MRDRDAARAAFLETSGRAGAGLEWRPGDASFRRYARLTDARGRAMLMDAPPPREDVGQFVRAAAMFRAAGLAVPEVIASDLDAGFLLLEDFGDDTFTALLNAGADAQPLYALATDALLRLAEAPAPQGLAAYAPAERVAHLATVRDWLWPELFGQPMPAAEQTTFDAFWLKALQAAPTLGEGLVHRDFHVDNLMRLEGRPGLAACGVLDFQDAAFGPLAYDLASLLEDARRPLDPDIRMDCLSRYRASRTGFAADEVDAALAVHGGQRHMRVLGLWIRLWRRDGKPGYLRHMPRTLSLLEASLRHPLLGDVAAYLDEALPARARARLRMLAEEGA